MGTLQEEKNGLKKSYKLFWIWLALFAAILTVYSCFPRHFGNLSPGKTVGLLACGALDLLFLLIYVTGNVYWTGRVSYEEAALAGRRERKRYALCHLALFLGVTLLFILYCFWLPGYWYTSSTGDSMAAGAAVCMGALASGRIKL